ncbi:MAG: hypothetical protein RI894_1069 [Bacteroidota bacterium]|jgi:acyl-CoA thioester hydrolase
MIKHKIELRVRYGETDRMGYVYYGNHALYLEVGRVELLRSLGYPYETLEADGVMCPVTAFEIRYVRPALYDEILTVTTEINEMPTQYALFESKITNEKGKLVSAAKVTLAFVDSESRKKCYAPHLLLEKINQYLDLA